MESCLRILQYRSESLPVRLLQNNEKPETNTRLLNVHAVYRRTLSDVTSVTPVTIDIGREVTCGAR